MFEEASSQEHLVAKVEAPYDLQFIPLMLDWATGITQTAGSDERETSGIRLALEETLAFIINAYEEAETWELINLGIRISRDGNTEISISNAGPPVHLDRISTYDPAAPSDEDLDGLWYFLASKMVDSLEFKNLGMDGWLIVIQQRIANLVIEDDSCIDDTTDGGSGKKIVFSSRLGTPEDAGDLIDLTYDTYRYSYPGEEFYRKSQLKLAIENKDIISVVVEDDGTIVGNSSISISEEAPHCAYMGALMVRRAYRKTRAIMHMIRETARYIDENPIEAEVYYGTMVTEHVASQKAGAKVGLHPVALLLAVGAAVDYRGMNIGDGARESFTICSRLTKPCELKTIYLPEMHQAIMRPLLDKIGCNAAFHWGAPIRLSEKTEYSMVEFASEGTANITIATLSSDWQNILRKLLFSFHARKYRTVVFFVPAWKQPPADIDERMQQLNAVFTGIKPVSANKYYLVYCALTDTMDFDRLKLADPQIDALKEHVRQLYDTAMTL